MATLTRKETLLNVSTSPHARSKLTTRFVMLDVIISLMPATILGVIHFGVNAALVILTSVLTAVLTEAGFCWCAKKKMTVGDLSSVVTGLLLALCLPAGVPLYVPFLGAFFAILFVKCFFGGLGKNIMNPALVGRCFLLIAFSGAMTVYTVDGVATATPLAQMMNGEAVSLAKVFLGQTSGCIGCSAIGLVAGAVYLLLVGGITWEIPVSTIVSFSLFLGLFGGKGFDPTYLLLQLCAGGVLMGAFFMATDPVTCPVTSAGQLVFGLVVGVLAGLFRVKGSSADSVSYAIIMSNMVVPFIDMLMVPKPYAYRKQKEKTGFPKPALVLGLIALISGLALSAVFFVTKDSIAEQELAAKARSDRAVCPAAEQFESDPAIDEKVAALNGEIYGTDFGKAYIDEVIVGKDASGNVAGYVIGATSGDGMDGNVSMSVGISADGTVQGISFTTLNETPGLGSLVGEPAFKDQFNGVQTDRFTLVSSGAAAVGEIDQVSGATISSRATVNAVNAALDFFAANIAN